MMIKSLLLILRRNYFIDKSLGVMDKSNILDCAQYILSFYGVEADFQGVVSQLDIDRENLSAIDLEKLATKTHMSFKKQELSVQRIVQMNVPLILKLSDKEYAVYRPGMGGQNEFTIPNGNQEDQERLHKSIETYSGEVYFLYPESIENDLDIEHMIKGNKLDWFWKPIVQYWGHYSEILICSFFINLFGLVMPVYTLNVYDRVIVNFAESTLIVLLVGVMIALTFDFLFKNIRAYILEKVASSIGTKHDRELMEKFMLLRSPGMQLTVGEKTYLFKELQGIRDFYSTKLVPACVDFPFFLLFLWVIYYLAPTIVWVPIVIACVIFLVDIFVQIPLNHAIKTYFSAMKDKSTLMIETLSGLRAMQLFNGVGPRLFKWNLVTSKSFEARRYNQVISVMIANFSGYMIQVANVLIVFFGAYEVSAGNLTIGGLIACSILSGRALAPVMNLSTIMSNYKQTKDVLDTIDQIFKLPDDNIYNRGLGIKKEQFNGDIESRNLFFQNPKQERMALEDITFKINAGEKVGLIGRSGAGKSTLTNLILGIYPPTKGMVYFDDYMSQAIASTELRRNMGYVPQQSFFFKGTIKENIMMGRDIAYENNLEEINHIAGVDLILQQSGSGLDMEIEENGDNLSGGQKQSIAIARALIAKPNILLFDEPTTGMDMMLEQHIKQTLSEYLKGRTLLMTTHRTSLMSLIDRIILLDNGRRIADGPRDEVLAKLSGKTTKKGA